MNHGRRNSSTTSRYVLTSCRDMAAREVTKLKGMVRQLAAELVVVSGGPMDVGGDGEVKWKKSVGVYGLNSEASENDGAGTVER